MAKLKEQRINTKEASSKNDESRKTSPDKSRKASSDNSRKSSPVKSGKTSPTKRNPSKSSQKTRNKSASLEPKTDIAPEIQSEETVQESVNSTEGNELDTAEQITP